MRKTAIVFILLFCIVALGQDKPYRILNSFNAGELTPLLIAREDLSKYQSGCSLMENMIPLPQGGAQKRPGTIYVAESRNNTKIRLIPFEYSTEQSYIIELGNQYARFFTNNAVITSTAGTADLSSLDNRLSHWQLNEAGVPVTVSDAEANHNGDATTSPRNLHLTGKVDLGCFDFKTQYAVEIADHSDFTFIEGTNGTFSVMAWIYVSSEDSSTYQRILTKWDETTGAEAREWTFGLYTSNQLEFALGDETNNVVCYRVTDSGLSAGWRFVCATYDGEHGSWTGPTAANFIKLYIDGSELSTTTVTNNASYVTMRDTATKVTIGAFYNSGLAQFYPNRIDNVAIVTDVLTAVEIAGLYTASATYEISTPYLTADLFELKYEQSADVLYITHPDYEVRKLSRIGNDDWILEPLSIENGPFRTQNTSTGATISASATTGSVTLTASGCTPFASTHISAYSPASKHLTGALFKLVHPLDTLEYKDTLEDDYAASTTEGVSWMDCGTLYEGAEWTWVTDGTWLGTVEVQRNYTIGAAHGAAGWETVFPYSGVTTARNVSTTGTEDDGDADYRVIFTDDTSGTVISYFSTDQTEHVGVVEITGVANSTSATGTVVKTLGSTNATHKWSEGSWSNYRGWPQTVTFFEDRLCFGGNDSQPDTIWGSVTSDYENMLAGTDDDDAIDFTLTSRQANAIQWLVGKDKILIGTSGAEWTLGGSSDEPLTPSNVKAEQHSTYGSANVQAVLANESVLFFQRGAERMRELAYNWELDSYVAPDMTILAKEVTGDGITDTAFQQIPDAILWCVRDDGEIATFSYERKENITAWSRQITDGDFESVAVIHGTVEDEVWVSVERTINSSTVRYIEYFSPRDFGSDLDDAFYVDSGYTYDSTATTSITELGHLIAEEVSVLGDGVIQTSQTVDGSGDIAITSALTVQVGLPYTVQMRTMPLSWVAQGMTIHGRIKRINEVITSWYNSGDFSIGRDSSTLETYSITGMTTNEERKTFPAGYDRYGYVYLYQLSPEPLTVLALMTEFKVQ